MDAGSTPAYSILCYFYSITRRRKALFFIYKMLRRQDISVKILLTDNDVSKNDTVSHEREEIK